MTQADVVSFSLSAGELTVRDEVGGGTVAIDVDADASLTPATDAWFDVPVDDAVSLETSSLCFRHIVSVFLRSDDGQEYGKVTEEPFEIDSHGTFIDVAATMKLLVYVERGSMTGRIVEDENGPADTVISFDEPTRIVVGARSTHEVPAATMTVTDDPEDLMTAVSALGSSIKEWSAERSWPTLRGHPPAIEVGETLQIPDELRTPDTNVTIAVPPATADVYRVAPLAYYLGAEVVPGERAELRIGSKHVEPLGSGQELEASIDELLARCLVLDSLVRIGGYYSLPRYEYDELAPELPFYPPELYDEPVDQQLLEYLEVPFSTIRPHVPNWSVTATLRPTTDDAEMLPSLLHALARIHVTEDGRPRVAGDDTAAMLSTSQEVSPGVASVSPVARDGAVDWDRRPPESTSLLFVGVPPGETDPFTPEGWERFRDDNCPTATYRESLTTAELRTAIEQDYLYIHYGGRVTEQGFVCSDGVLPFEDLPEGATGVLSVRWPGEGIAPVAPLRDVATVVALTDTAVTAETAQRFGMYLSLALTPALSADIAGTADHMRFLGDPSRSLVSRSSGSPPTILRIESIDDEQYRVAADLALDDADELGQVQQIIHDQVHDMFQLTGTVCRFETPLSASEVESLATIDAIRLFVDDADESRSYSIIDRAPPSTE